MDKDHKARCDFSSICQKFFLGYPVEKTAQVTISPAGRQIFCVLLQPKLSPTACGGGIGPDGPPWILKVNPFPCYVKFSQNRYIIFKQPRFLPHLQRCHIVLKAGIIYAFIRKLNSGVNSTKENWIVWEVHEVAMLFIFYSIIAMI